MPKVSSIVANPAVHFVEPLALAEEPKLTPDEKLVALATWEKDAAAVATADDEGMAPQREEVPLADLVDEAKVKVLAELPDGAQKAPATVTDADIDPDRYVQLKA